MTATAKLDGNQTISTTSRHSARLKALSEEASEIRRAHLAGKITSEEAADRLEKLQRRHMGFLERLIDL